MTDVPLQMRGFSRRRLLRQMRDAAVAALLLPAVSLSRAGQVHQTLKAGILRIGTYFVNPPFEFISGGERVGFEVDLMKELARRLDLQPQFVNTQWEVILHEMQENLYDCIVGGITITPARQKLLAWSAPYMTTTLSLLVDRARSPEIMRLADLKGGTVAVQAATTDFDAAVAMQRAGEIGSVKVYPFARIADAITDLAAGRVNAVMKVYPVAAWFVRTTPGIRILTQVPNNPQPLGIGFRKNNASLVAAVDRALNEMQQDGSFKATAQHWKLS
jgi:ABC-type amino acid transport substrate-binding protein